MEEKDSKRSNITKAIVTLVIIAIIVLGIIYIFQKNDAEAQLKDFEKSVENGDKESVSQYLSNNNRKMTTKEAGYLIDYLNKKENKKRLNKSLDEAINNAKSSNSSSELSSFRDKDNEPVIDFHKNGKQLLFLDKISIEPHYRDVYIQELDNNATYILSKNNKVPVDKNKISKLGSFVVGDYTIDLKKAFDYTSVEDSVDGKIYINTDNKKDGKIIAKQSFPQTRIKIKLHNDEKLKSKSEKLLINGDVKKLKENKIYGYFPNEKTFSVRAEGDLNNQVFKTKPVDVYKGLTNNSTQTVNLYFDKKAIDENIRAEKKDKESIKKSIKNYISKLNKAYQHKSYKEVSDYIKNGSEAEKELKQRFKHKQDVVFKSVKVNSVEKHGNKYNVVVSKKTNRNTIKTQYVVDRETKQIESYKNL